MAKRLKSGHILRLPLWHGWGFAYAKYVNVVGLQGNDLYPDLLKIFDYRSPTDEPLQLNKLGDYLTQPVLLAGRLPTMRQQLWQIVGEMPLLDEDRLLPDMRVREESISNSICGFSPPRPGATLYTRNLAIRPAVETATFNAAHLEFIGAFGSGLIEIRATMAFMQQEGASIADYFDLNDPRDKYEYELIKDRPLANTLPKSLYGRARQPGDPGYVELL
ncbi:hypothetical protein [Hymenobacter sp. BT730]|uniref:hypothetical protein n=1 Tax=Hymenobacter sp. BT730 TaxID=3063332 RepID=UPI0026DFC2C5|nr:hypothetical protein [Hymenobacter sp. BT730]